jgi:hypothetical protein
MSKQVTPPPPGDKPSPSAPPPPPAWRHWLWPIGILIALALFYILPAARGTSPVTLNYTQLISKLDAHQVKTISLGQSGQTSTGTLTDGKDFTTIIPGPGGLLPAEPAPGREGPGHGHLDRGLVRLGGPHLADHPAAAAPLRLSMVPAVP